MQAAKMEYKSVYNDKKAEPLRRTLLFCRSCGKSLGKSLLRKRFV